MLDCFLSTLLDLDQNDTDIVTIIIKTDNLQESKSHPCQNPAFSTGTLKAQKMIEQLQPATGQQHLSQEHEKQENFGSQRCNKAHLEVYR